MTIQEYIDNEYHEIQAECCSLCDDYDGCACVRDGLCIPVRCRLADAIETYNKVRE
jgi:hypothetical protein